jgi:hypothetical protein
MINIGLLSKAIKNLKPEAQFVLSEPNEWIEIVDENDNPTGSYTITNLNWIDSSVLLPSREEIEQEIDKLAFLANYQTPRTFEYPPLSDLADALYWQSKGDDSKMTAYLAAVDAVKQKYPKGV